MIKKCSPWARLTILIGLVLFSWTVGVLALVGLIYISKLAGWMG